MTDTVLVTGASGFIGGHITAELLSRGYAVRGSVRSMVRADELRATMTDAGADIGRLEVRQLDLASNAGWSAAVDGCRFVLHVASPFVLAKPKDVDEIIRPAVEGTRRVIASALDAGVERVVVTSALATMQFARRPQGHLYTSSDWTPEDGPGINAYTRSKVMAEREAWRIVEERGVRDRLATIHPGAVIGPLLTDEVGTSVSAIQQIMAGALPMIPDLRLPWVHVRDIVDAHIHAMASPLAAGTRTIVSADRPHSLIEVAAMLRRMLPEASTKLPKRSMPTWLTWAASLFEPQLRDNRWLIGANQHFDQHAAESLLERPLTAVDDAIEDTARSLIQRALI